MIVPGVLFAAMALLNSGCGSNGCNIPASKKQKK
jgi:hypothetical protein